MSDIFPIIGIDPGNSGAIAVCEQFTDAISRNKKNHVRVFKFSEYGYSGIVEKVARIAPKTAFLEQVHSFPGQGVASTWKFAENYGFYIGMLEALEIKTTKVTPQKWQKFYNLPSRKEVGKAGLKSALREEAKKIYPNLKASAETADALLILHWAIVQSSPQSSEE